MSLSKAAYVDAMALTTARPGQVTRRIYLFRHAKSSWEGDGLEDHDRPLSPRGEHAARAMADYVRREGVAPDLVLCSTAVRARQTLEALSLRGENRYEEGLYGAGAAWLVSRLRRVPGSVGSAMLVGHNPGLQDLAVLLAGKGDPLLLARVREKLPTGALIGLTFHGEWTSLAEHKATLESFVTPRDL
ncbi:MAG TPA: histidine phosphatase family protein [Acidimicrobiales bacterium]|nr:histidine phosphatase family protein [Acidimicrobiales bacterium]